MAYRKKIFDLITRALHEEQEELRRLHSGRWSDVSSIHQLEEAWMQYVVFKAAIRRRWSCVRVCCEFSKNKSRADFALLTRRDRPVAAVEFKSGKPNRRLQDGVQSDLRRNRTFPERYVAALVYQEKEGNRNWIARMKGASGPPRIFEIRPAGDREKSLQLYFFESRKAA